MTHDNLLGGPAPTRLPEGPEGAVTDMLRSADAAEAAAAHPAASLAWAELSTQAWDRGEVVESYAYARVGYHRGLDALRRSGWRGHGPVPWEHVPNRGFLRCLHALGRAAAQIGEVDEADRCRQFLDDCDPTARAAIEA
jgi:hypothetical protein